MGDPESGVWYALTLGIGSDAARHRNGLWDPPLEMNRWRSPHQPGTTAGGLSDRRVVTPPVEVRIDDDGMMLVAEMPGIPRDNIEIRVAGRNVEILAAPPGVEDHGRRVSPDDAGHVRAAELIPCRVPDPSLEGPDAFLRGGVLELRVPKSVLLRGDGQGRIPVR